MRYLRRLINKFWNFWTKYKLLDEQTFNASMKISLNSIHFVQRFEVIKFLKVLKIDICFMGDFIVQTQFLSAELFLLVCGEKIGNGSQIWEI